MNFSVDRDVSLFGLDEELDTHLSKLEAARAFAQLRKDIDRNITTLKTLTLAAFGKRRTKNTFKENVELVVKEERGGRVLSPLFDMRTMRTDDNTINLFILGCFTLSKTAYANLDKNRLTDVFADFFIRVVDDYVIFAELRERFIEIIKTICQENAKDTSRTLLGLSLMIPNLKFSTNSSRYHRGGQYETTSCRLSN